MYALSLLALAHQPLCGRNQDLRLYAGVCHVVEPGECLGSVYVGQGGVALFVSFDVVEAQQYFVDRVERRRGVFLHCPPVGLVYVAGLPGVYEYVAQHYVVRPEVVLYLRVFQQVLHDAVSCGGVSRAVEACRDVYLVLTAPCGQPCQGAD